MDLLRLTLWQRLKLRWRVRRVLLRLQVQAWIASWVTKRLKGSFIEDETGTSCPRRRTESSEPMQPGRGPSCQEGRRPLQPLRLEWTPDRVKLFLRRADRCRMWCPILAKLFARLFFKRRMS